MAQNEIAGRVTAVLGPTNTGKTHLAIERMLGHASGMIGFPLRLLARENYDRIVRVKGRNAVALVTGEERILPPNPSYFVCTVEAMPLDRPVSFLGVDEIQLVGDRERGHVFTERLLHARGLYETMFMGSDTIRPLLRKLVPEAEIVERPRFSTLTYTGPRKVTRLPPRSAVVAFAVADVFELAELVRRQRGGTAVVLGALSPRARNAQVAMYQAGEVDYMVATDAIGMGLNMDLDHVAFARLSKFDGTAPRRLTVPEIAQIAGRAGRHMNDGSFGTTAEAGPLDPEVVEAVENHRFDPLTAVWWRNAHLDFRSGALLLRSLEAPPPLPVMLRVREADDQLALAALLRQPEIARRATHPGAVRLLWDVCQVPDFRKIMSEHHARLLGQIWHHLMSPAERLPNDWVASQISRLDRVDGEIDTLVQRIAHIRTWTYITHRAGWLEDGAHWQERALAIEDRLSDALHDRLTQRFVDRRAASLVRSLAEARDLFAAVSSAGEVRVEGHYLGEMRGFRFIPDATAQGEAARALLAAANRMLRGEIATRAKRLAAEPDAAFVLTAEGGIAWQGETVARLASGETVLAPRVEILAADFLDGPLRDLVRRRLEDWLRAAIGRGLKPLLAALAVPAGAAGRGLLFRLGETLGTLDAVEAAGLVAGLESEDRKRLGKAGIRFGTETIHVAGALKPAAVAMRALLWSVHLGAALPPPLPPPGRLSVAAGTLAGAAYAEAIGYRVVGPRAIRVDRLEPLAAALRKRARLAGGFALEPELAALVGAPLAELPEIVAALGYRGAVQEGVLRFAPLPRRARRNGRGIAPAPRPVAPDHPFARLKEMEFNR
jgi:ATP-dependent RNA helicase SUPV3L1/SUV3